MEGIISNPDHYTPTPIISYIIKKTVLPCFHQDASSFKKRIDSLKILDPACGSGLFLTITWDFLNKNLDLIPKEERLQYKKSFLAMLYGIEIDPKAAQLTRENILKKLQNSKNSTIQNDLVSEFQEIVNNNIICGDTLIDSEDIDPEGFDIIIGNPPYRLVQPESYPLKIIRYFQQHYEVAQYKIDLYHLFLEKAICLLKPEGLLGFIVPNTFLTNIYTQKLREFILRECFIQELITIPKAFAKIEVDSVIIILKKRNKSQIENHNTIKVRLNVTLQDLNEDPNNDGIFSISQETFLSNPTKEFFLHHREPLKEILLKIESQSVPLGNIYRINFGLQTQDRRKFPDFVITEHLLQQRMDLSPEQKAKYHRCITGKDVQPFFMKNSDKYVLFDPNLRSGGCWDPEMHFLQKKIVVRQIGITPIAAIDHNGYPCLNTVFMLACRFPTYTPELITGILNSHLMAVYWHHMFSDFKQLFPKIKKEHLVKIPIPDISKNTSIDESIFQNIHELVLKRMDERNKLEHAKIEEKLNNEMYHLYGLNIHEIEQCEALYESIFMNPKNNPRTEDLKKGSRWKAS
jgi:tRNA1(Val) A37 N6-methylase TrmN6